jgi:hypothetical protein
MDRGTHTLKRYRLEAPFGMRPILLNFRSRPEPRLAASGHPHIFLSYLRFKEMGCSPSNFEVVWNRALKVLL